MKSTWWVYEPLLCIRYTNQLHVSKQRLVIDQLMTLFGPGGWDVAPDNPMSLLIDFYDEYSFAQIEPHNTHSVCFENTNRRWFYYVLHESEKIYFRNRDDLFYAKLCITFPDAANA